MALTKADMAESLFNELGLNKREARELVDVLFEDLRAALVLATLICGIRINARVATLKQAKKFRLLHDVW